jgi:acyl-CoA oxidase
LAILNEHKGDNTILTLQLGRYLVNCYRDARSGKKLSSGVGYLNQLPAILNKKCTAKNENELMDLNVIGEAFDVVTANMVKKLGEDFEQAIKSGMDTDAAYEEIGTFG